MTTNEAQNKALRKEIEALKKDKEELLKWLNKTYDDKYDLCDSWANGEAHNAMETIDYITKHK